MDVLNLCFKFLETLNTHFSRGMSNRTICSLAAGALCVNTCLSQGTLTPRAPDPEDVMVSIEAHDISVMSTLDLITNQTEYGFLFLGETYSRSKTRKVNLKVTNKSVADVLQVITQQTGATFTQVDDTIVINYETPANQIESYELTRLQF